MVKKIKSLLGPAADKLSPTAKLRLFGLFKIPLLFIVSPKVKRLDNQACEVELPLNKITKNHLNSMYFGALAIGADCVVAVFALYKAEQFKDKKLVPIFKDLKADFIKRAESDVVFSCSEGAKIDQMINRAVETSERVTEPVYVEARTPKLNNELVATFTMGFSVKLKS